MDGKLIKLFIDLLNKVRVGMIDNNKEQSLNARFIHESNQIYPKHVLLVFAENEPATKRNEAFLNDLPGEFCTIEANDKL